jgi:hypothetical protein
MQSDVYVKRLRDVLEEVPLEVQLAAVSTLFHQLLQDVVLVLEEDRVQIEELTARVTQLEAGLQRAATEQPQPEKRKTYSSLALRSWYQNRISLCKRRLPFLHSHYATLYPDAPLTPSLEQIELLGRLVLQHLALFPEEDRADLLMELSKMASIDPTEITIAELDGRDD